MIKRILLLAGALLVVFAAPAAAQYAPGGVTSDVNGRNITLEACGYAPGSTVTFSTGGTVLGSATAGSDGCAVGNFVISGNIASGNVSITASGTGANGAALNQSTTVQLPGQGAGNQGQGQGNLPRTGSNLTVPLSMAGAALIALGGFVVMTNRRRTTADV
jgi:LPXTG-motif cell wall-anchored protein